MNKLLLVAFFSAITVAGCELIGTTIELSGESAVVEDQSTGFTELAVGNAFDVTIERTDDYFIRVEIDKNLEEYLRIVKKGNVLNVNLKPGINYDGNDHPTLVVRLPALTGVDLSGATNATMEAFETEGEFVIDLSGASKLEGSVTAGSISLDLSGASDITLQGDAPDIAIDGSGASIARLDDLTAENIDVDLSGASKAHVNLTGELTGSVSGASIVEYTGDPSLIDVSKSGDSAVIKK